MKYYPWGLFTSILFLLLNFLGCRGHQDSGNHNGKMPNIVLIYLDDLGYGDMGAYGSTILKTPQMDFIANNGLRFTDGHAASATCTPSRYALLTGIYPWRNKDAKILPGTAPLLIDTAQVTLPGMLKDKGYATGVVGKWHLGLGDGEVDWNKNISPGPNEVGFDYSYIMAATQDRVPTVYLENGSVVGLDPTDPLEVDYQQNYEGEPTGLDHPEMLKMNWHHGHNNSIVNGIPRIGYMRGGKTAQWKDEDMADIFLEKAQDFVEKQKKGPFFLYYAMQQPHVPRTPHPRFAGKSALGPRGDVIMEADWCIGELIKTLEEGGILDNTLIILTSDNGPVLNDGYYDDAEEQSGNHSPAGPLRGGKYSLFEGGTRVPFITFWKNKILPGTSNALVSQIDLLSSLANLVGSETQTRDSENILGSFLGIDTTGRNSLILEATSRTALRQGKWLMIPPYDGPALNKQVNIELGNSKEFQLFNLEEDTGQQHNLAQVQTDKLKEMIDYFEKIRGEDYGSTEKLELQ